MTINPQRHIRFNERDAGRTASLRCTCYATLSELACSPHDMDPRKSLREKVGMVPAYDSADGLDGVLREFVEIDLDRLRYEYSAIFEVGNQGPPCPIREDLQTGQRKGTREDLVRYYDFFNYKLEEKYAWAPDHLSVELEFMHFLCFLEASADADAASFQLAQVDFSERHLVRWVSGLAKGVARAAPDSIYRRVVGVIDGYIAADHDWQCGTIITKDENGEREDIC